MIVLLAYVLLLGNTGMLLYAAFAMDSHYREIVLQITGSLTAILFWLSEYFSQSKCDANGVIDFLLLLGKKFRSGENNIAVVSLPDADLQNIASS